MSSTLLGSGRAPLRAFGGGTAIATKTVVSATRRREPTTDIEEVLRRAEGTEGAELDAALVGVAVSRGDVEAFEAYEARAETPGHHNIEDIRWLGLDDADADNTWARALAVLQTSGMDPERVLASAIDNVNNLRNVGLPMSSARRYPIPGADR